MIPFARLSLNAQSAFANRPRKPKVSRDAMAWPGSQRPIAGHTSKMNMAIRNIFFERVSAQNPAHCREPAMFLSLRVMLVVGDRLEIRGACELNH